MIMDRRVRTLNKKIILPVILIFAAAFMTGCSDDGGGSGASEEGGAGGVISIDLSGGEGAFIGYEPEMINLEVIRQGETMNFSFTGISLNSVLEQRGVAEFTKIELVVSDMEENMDITDWAAAEAGVFLAWSESGIPESPFRVFPKDAGTGNLLIRYVTEIIITKHTG